MARPRLVARGVELFPARTPTLPPATHTNSYALGDREVVLIEPATPHDDERRAWLGWAESIRAAGRTLVAIALTHHHADHVGGAAFFARALGLPIWAHRSTADRLPELAIARHLDEGEAIDLAGPTPQRWRVFHTPGHAPGHLCFVEESSRAAILGDMVASVGTILIEPIDGDMKRYLAELARLESLGLELGLPAHGEPIDAPTALLRHYIEHRLKREAKAVAALGDTPQAVEALVPVVYADTSPLLWPIARLSLEAHLVKLETEGVARHTDAGWSRAS